MCAPCVLRLLKSCLCCGATTAIHWMQLSLARQSSVLLTQILHVQLQQEASTKYRQFESAVGEEANGNNKIGGDGNNKVGGEEVNGNNKVGGEVQAKGNKSNITNTTAFT